MQQDIIDLALLCGVYIIHLSAHTSRHGNIVWKNTYTTRLEPIRKLQKKIIRIITNSNFKEHTGPLFKELLISPLDDIYKQGRHCFVHVSILQQQSTIIFQ